MYIIGYLTQTADKAYFAVPVYGDDSGALFFHKLDETNLYIESFDRFLGSVYLSFILIFLPENFVKKVEIGDPAMFVVTNNTHFIMGQVIIFPDFFKSEHRLKIETSFGEIFVRQIEELFK